MDSVAIPTTGGSYQVYIGEGIRHKAASLVPKSYDQVLIITDEHVGPLYLNDVKEAFEPECELYDYSIPAGEQSKSLSVYDACISYAIENSLDRNSLVVALGGGVVGDLAGFVASTYMRGVDYIQIPTTILAHDSSVGGKVAINHPLGKNMVGSFYQPSAVIYDTETLSTLTLQEWRSGMSEVIKHAFLKDLSFLNECLQLPSFKQVSSTTLKNLLRRGITVKSNIVAEDFRERGIRSYLNFGHTLGHAIEAELGYGEITHGEAVAIGMDFALFVSEYYYKDNALPIKEYRSWLTNHNYVFHSLAKLSDQELLERMKRDKKTDKKHIRLVLLKSIGNPELVSFEDDKIKFFLQEYRKTIPSHLK